jgi:hypothetical protein
MTQFDIEEWRYAARCLGKDAVARLTRFDVVLRALFEFRVEVHGWQNKIDMRGYVRRKVVRITCDVVCARFMFVNVILGLKESFNLLYGDVDLDPIPARAQPNTVAVESAVNQPGADGIDSVVAGSKGGCDPAWGPMLSKVGGFRVGHIEEEVIDVVKV